MPSFCCEQCDKVFSYQGALDMHTLTHRAKANAPSKTDTPSTKRAPGHQCMICDIVFPYGPGRLARHLSSITHRAHVREMGIYCSCGKDFLNPAGFPYHQCTSPSDKPPWATLHGFNDCRICGATIRSQDDLIQHKSSQRHMDRAKEQGYMCACVRFFLDLATMEQHKCFDGGMIDQAGSIGNGTGTPPRSRLNCTGCEKGFPGEWEFFSYHMDYKGVHSPVWTSPPVDARAHVITCQPCGVDLYQEGSLRAHQRMQSHIDMCLSKSLYCLPCEKLLNSDADAQRHRLRFHDPNGPTGFRSKKLRKKHKPRHAPPAGHHTPPAGPHTCEPCNLKFPTKTQLKKHLSSENHKAVKCFGGEGCIRKFKDLPGMLTHLELGLCKSKIDRITINALLRKHGTGNIITIEDAGETATPAILPGWSSTSQIASTSAVFEEVDTDSDDEDSDGIIFTPTSTPSRRSSIDTASHHPLTFQLLPGMTARVL